jgi:acyl-CoA synthetase (AMP-forming)/AMP-acid ligase II
MASEATYWDKQIVVEEVGGVPFRMYSDRPRRIEHLLAFADHWDTMPHLVQGERVVTFGGLRRASAAKAQELAGLGVGRRDRVLLLGWNSPDWVINFWACLQMGAVPVLGNAWWSEGELDHALDALQPAIALADARGAAKIAPRWRRGPWEVSKHAVDAPTVDTSHADAASMDENEPAVIIFTSGTEGRAKAVVLAHRSLLAGLQMLLHVTRRLPYQLDDTPAEVSLHTGPLFHIGGVRALLWGVTVGNTLVMPTGRFDPAEALALIERYQISRWNAVPTMATRLLDHPDVRRRELRSLRAVTLGGAPVHAELMQRMGSGLPSVQPRVATGYGLSENCGQATAASGADTVERPGSSGRPLPCVELKIAPQSRGGDGEILLRSPTQMLGYFGDEVSPIDPDGWLHTGDLGRVDDSGYLWVTGRCKDMIIRGGENIAPAAVEQALVAMPGVADAVVFGVPHPDLGEEVMAVVVVEGELTPQDLQEQLQPRVASFAVPSRWQLRTEPLPVNQTGKIDKAALVAQARAQLVNKDAKAVIHGR